MALDYQPKIELGQIIQTVGSLIGVFFGCIFAYAVLVKDVEYNTRELQNVKEMVLKESTRREAEDAKLREEFQRRANEIKEEIKLSEDRTRYLLEDIRANINLLVKDRLDDGQ